MTRILITGAAGQLGRALSRNGWPDTVELHLAGRDAIDLARPDALAEAVRSIAPDAIVNCAAYTAVDRAEDDVAAAYAVNAVGAGALARAARLANIPMVHVSTDYVFGASGSGVRAEADPVAPLGVYGASKLSGEIAAAAACDRLAVVRTAWLVSPFGANFVTTMLRLAAEREDIAVVDDQRGCPTGADDLAAALATITLRMVGDAAAPRGLFHFVNDGAASWADLAEAVMDEARRHALPTARIRRIVTADYPTRAARPADSRLGTDRIGREYGIAPRPWKTMVAAVVAEIAASRRD